MGKHHLVSAATKDSNQTKQETLGALTRAGEGIVDPQKKAVEPHERPLWRGNKDPKIARGGKFRHHAPILN